MKPYDLTTGLVALGLAGVVAGTVTEAQSNSPFTKGLGSTAITEDVVLVGDFGCTSGSRNPTLDDGVTQAYSLLKFQYDAGTQELWLTVSNDAPMSATEPHPLITDVWFNVPRPGLRLDLVGQDAAGTNDPFATLTLDDDPRSGPGLPAGCFGNFAAHLDMGPGLEGSIRHPKAPMHVAPPSAVESPVVFTFQVSGPGAAALTATDFARAKSFGAPMSPFASVSFDGGGRSGSARGTLACSNVCDPDVVLLGSPCILEPITLVLDGHPDCRGCLVGSFEPGPTFVGIRPIPIGLPATAFVVGPTGSSLNMTIRNDPTLIGQTIHFMAVLTDGATVEYSPRRSFTICP